MAAGNYDGLAEHKARHDDLKRTLDDLVRDFEEEGATHVLADAIDTLLGNWLVQHIREVDMKFGAYVKAHGLVLTEGP